MTVQSPGPDVELVLLTEANLTDLLDSAVADADPDEVMPTVDGPPGWNEGRRDAFRRFHRARSIAAAQPVETTYVITVEGGVVGAARLEPVSDSRGSGVELGMWIGRSQRGRGVGRAVVAQLVALAEGTGAQRIVASTTTGNVAAQQLLRGIGATLTTTGDSIHATLDSG